MGGPESASHPWQRRVSTTGGGAFILKWGKFGSADKRSAGAQPAGAGQYQDCCHQSRRYERQVHVDRPEPAPEFPLDVPISKPLRRSKILLTR
jgi:hypothetical protein